MYALHILQGHFICAYLVWIWWGICCFLLLSQTHSFLIVLIPQWPQRYLVYPQQLAVSYGFPMCENRVSQYLLVSHHKSSCVLWKHVPPNPHVAPHLQSSSSSSASSSSSSSSSSSLSWSHHHDLLIIITITSVNSCGMDPLTSFP